MEIKVTDHHDSIAFRCFVEDAIVGGCLQNGDILVCDNASLHKKGYNCELSRFLWETPGLDEVPLHILLLPLPTRSP